MVHTPRFWGEGDTLQEKVENHFLASGVTKAEIESIRRILIENNDSNDTEIDP